MEKVVKVAVSSFFLISVLFSGVYKEVHTKSDGFKGFGKFEGTRIVKLQEQRKQEVNETDYSGVMGIGKKTVRNIIITSIPEDRVYTLDPEKKTYIERTISLPEGEEPEWEEEVEYSEEQEVEPEKPTKKILKNELKIRKTKQKKQIGEFQCEEYQIIWTFVTQDLETKEIDTTELIVDLWNTPVTEEIKNIQEQEKKFAIAYLKKMGVEWTEEQYKMLGLGFIGAILGAGEGGVAPEKLKKAFEKIEGYPIVTEVTWLHKSAKKEEKVEMEAPESPSGIGGAFKRFAKKVVEKKAEKEVKEAYESRPVFHTYTEVKRLQLKDFTSEIFQIPEGYKKEEVKGTSK